MSDLHVVSNDPAAGALRYAIRLKGLTGSVYSFGDEYGFGPLTNAEDRAVFWKQYGCLPDLPADQLMESWDVFRNQIATVRPSRVLVWCSENASGYVFLRMICWLLAGENVPLFRVNVPRPAVVDYPAEDLMRFLSSALSLVQMVDRRLLGEQFISIASRHEMLRKFDENGQLCLVGLDAYDDLILKQCTTAWKSASEVMVATMNKMGMGNRGESYMGNEGFLSARLRQLIDSGRLEADGPYTYLRGYSVRRSR
ncbi:DUF1835 domain-containing protein [Burkholderia pyrrocinia]